jgi:prepilin-type N-terminal cleavage/methylation domain-containing protein
MKRFSFYKNNKGLTLTELLVVMVIIGLLSTIAVPVYISRMEDARIRVAKAEARELGQAEEQCGLLQGYYVPLQLLDDQPIPQQNFGSTYEDRIDRENSSQIYVINPLISPSIQLNTQELLNSNKARIEEMISHWSGPYMTFQRYYVPPGQDSKDPNYQFQTDARRDFPLDPWGEPYRMYSPIGVVGTGAENSASSNGYSESVFNGRITSNDNRGFERYAVVSFGRDNLSDLNNGGTNRDDVVYLFGSGGVESSFGLRD